MKGKKKKKGGRKLRKQKRKQSQQPFDKWLTPIKSSIRALSNRLMKEKMDRLQNLPLHDRFVCSKCKKLYCLNNEGEVCYCTECWLGDNWVNCAKTVQDIRVCENCRE